MKKLYYLFFILFSTIEVLPQWVQTDGPSDGIVNALIVSGENLFAGVDNGGVFLSSNNGTNWVSINNGLTDTRVRCLAISDTNIFAGTEESGVFHSVNNGAIWTPCNDGLTDLMINALAVSGTNIFAGTNSGIFLSTNNGTNWKDLSTIETGIIEVSTIAVLGTNIFFGTYYYGVFCSTNNGNNWIHMGLPTPLVWSLIVSGNTLFALTLDEVYFSTDNGTIWTPISKGLIGTSIWSLAVSDFNLFAGTYQGVYLSTNNGTSWSSINTGLTNTDIWSLAANDSYLFAGTYDKGVWRRPLSEIVPVELNSFTATANGKEVTLNWSTATELNNQGFEVQRKFGSNDFITVGSVKGQGTTTSQKNYTYIDKLANPGKYVYRLKQIDFGGTFEYSHEIEVEVRTLDEFTLDQNYPNPFNPKTKISWQSPVSSWQVLKVFDLIGNEVTTLVDEYRSKGNYEVELDASSFASGIYFYQLKAIPSSNSPKGQAGRVFIDTKKLILLK